MKQNKVNKVKDSKKSIRNMLGLLKPYKIRFIFVMIVALGSTVFTVIGPKIMGQATTVLFDGLLLKIQGLGGVDFDRIAKILIFLLIIYLLSLIFAIIQGFVMAGISRNLTYSLRKRMHAKIDKLPLSYFDKRTTGDILSLVSNDIDVIDANLTQSLTQLLTSVATVVGILYMMFSINWIMTLAALVILPVSFLVMVFIFSKSQIHFKGQQDNLGVINGHIEEMYGAHTIVKAFNGEEQSIEKFNEANDDLYESAWKSTFFSGLAHPMIVFISNLGYVIISILGGYFASGGVISVGEIQSFIQYMRSFMNPIAQLGSLSSTFQQSLAAVERVFDYLEADEEDASFTVTVDEEAIQGSVTFDHVSFGYDPEKIIVNDFSTEVKPGQKIAIVGPTGAGKTTIVKLLMRFYDLNEGSISIDGINIADMSKEQLRNLIGMVLQDTWLYSGSILENIRYGKLDASDEAVFESAKAAQADHFIRTLSEGYDTILNEDSSNISQGQMQLLTIARAMLADPKILILDEATSSVDTRTEVLIQTALDKLMEGRTSFIIAHRLSTIRNADLILVMDKGDIVESGNHVELLAKEGFYAELYNSQFSED
ncbi:MAG TPA: ABC transporter ATP-binding protein [Erysipelothrix sp.]|nr:ABC transporter ATP-binding protein [Erysipelothrix sp.]